jgi:esterase/lipase
MPLSDDKLAQRKKQKIFFKNDDMDFDLLWALGYQTGGGSELGECFHTASLIRENDPESWAKAWSDTAARLEAQAGKAKAGGHAITARSEYLRAFTYRKMASMGLRHSDSRLREEWSKGRVCFRSAAGLMDKTVDAVEISYRGGILPGYFMHGDSDSPTLIMFIGGEGWAEDGYFFIGHAGQERGYNILAIEIQINQGTRFLNDKLLAWETIEDVEATLKTVIDFAMSGPGVDKERLAIIGFSGGGYFALKAASIDQRIKACIPDSPIYDMYGILKSELPGPLVNAPAFITNSLVKLSSFNNSMSMIDLEKFCWAVGVQSITEFMDACKKLGKVDVEKIVCPILCLASEGEGQSMLEQAREVYDMVRSEKKLIHVFTAAEGADAHCQLNNFSIMQEAVYDWLDDIFHLERKTGRGSL